MFITHTNDKLHLMFNLNKDMFNRFGMSVFQILQMFQLTILGIIIDEMN